jgi:hypothetical protein
MGKYILRESEIPWREVMPGFFVKTLTYIEDKFAISMMRANLVYSSLETRWRNMLCLEGRLLDGIGMKARSTRLLPIPQHAPFRQS